MKDFERASGVCVCVVGLEKMNESLFDDVEARGSDLYAWTVDREEGLLNGNLDVFACLEIYPWILIDLLTCALTCAPLTNLSVSNPWIHHSAYDRSACLQSFVPWTCLLASALSLCL